MKKSHGFLRDHIFLCILLANTPSIHLICMERLPTRDTKTAAPAGCVMPRSNAELQENLEELPGSVPESTVALSLADARRQSLGARGRRKSVCVFTQQDTRSSLSELSPESSAAGAPPLVFPKDRRLSVKLSEITDRSLPESTLRQETEFPDRRDSLTSQLSVELSPHEKDEVDAAIREIRQTENPISKADKQSMLLLNLMISHLHSLAESTKAGNAQAVEQVHTMAKETEENLYKVQETLTAMHEAQKYQRRLNYISLSIGLVCGVGLFLFNYLSQQTQQNQ
jgi:hypothetical protein